MLGYLKIWILWKRTDFLIIMVHQGRENSGAGEWETQDQFPQDYQQVIKVTCNQQETEMNDTWIFG